MQNSRHLLIPSPPRRRLLAAGATSLLLHLLCLRPPSTPAAAVPGPRLAATLQPPRPASPQTPAAAPRPQQRPESRRLPQRQPAPRSQPAATDAASGGPAILSDLQLAAYRLALYRALPETRPQLAGAIGDWHGEAALTLRAGPNGQATLVPGAEVPPALAAHLRHLTLAAVQACPQPPPLSAGQPTISLAYLITA